MKINFSISDFNDTYLEALTSFIKNLGSSGNTFRYFESRNLKEALSNHTKTLLLITGGQVIGYGHLDKDPGDLKLWLGICIKEDFCGRGLGKKLIQSLLKNQDEDIFLSVDSDNIAGVSLYQKYGFSIIKSSDGVTYMNKNV